MQMAAVFLPASTSPPPALSYCCKVKPECLYRCFGHMQVHVMSFPAHYPDKRCSIMVSRACHRRRFERHFSVTAALEVGGIETDDQSTFGVVGPENVQSLKDLEKQLDDLFNEVKMLISLGKESDAAELLEANYGSVKEQLDAGAKGIEEAAIMDVIALGYMALGNTRAVGSLLDSLNLVVNGLEDNEPLLDSILSHMGSMYEKLEKFEKSIDVYSRAINITTSKYGDSSTVLTTPLLERAKVMASIGNATEAIEGYHQVIKILESSRGPISEELVLPFVLLGNLLLKERREMEAEEVFNRIITTYKKLYGEEDGRVGLAMSSLAHVKCAKGEVNEAIDLYKNALCLIKDSNFMALDDEVMEKMRIDLAELLHVVGRLVYGTAKLSPLFKEDDLRSCERAEEGRTLIEESLSICETYRGKDNPSCVTHVVNPATSYSSSKNFTEAERLLRIGLQIMHRNLHADDQSITVPMLHLAVTLYSLKRYEDAEKIALEVLDKREKAFGKESPLVGEALDCLVSIQSRLGRDDTETLKLLERILKIKEIVFGSDSMEVVDTLNKIVHCLDKLGMRIEKLPLQRRLALLRNKYKQAVKY